MKENLSSVHAKVSRKLRMAHLPGLESEKHRDCINTSKDSLWCLGFH